MKSESTPIKIGKNAPCPCGSGKIYRRCCKGKGVTFEFFECGDKKFAYDLNAVNARLTRLSNYCFTQIITPFNRNNTIDRETGSKILQDLYGLLDQVLAPFLKQSSCKKGCKECCNLVVEVTPIEADMIRTYVDTFLDPQCREHLATRIEAVADCYGDPASLGDKYAHLKVERYLHSELRCPFYTQQSTCMVYPARPLGCRTHIVYSSPLQCRTRKIVDYYDGTYFPHIYKAVECLSRLVHTDMSYEKHLADWFVQEFRF